MKKLKATVYYSLKGEIYTRTKNYTRRFDASAEDVDKAVIGAQVKKALLGEMAWKHGDTEIEIKNIVLFLVEEIW
jgi:hypothetical protein